MKSNMKEAVLKKAYSEKAYSEKAHSEKAHSEEFSFRKKLFCLCYKNGSVPKNK